MLSATQAELKVMLHGESMKLLEMRRNLVLGIVWSMFKISNEKLKNIDVV